MELRADFSQRVVVHTDELEWIPSPMAGVDRRMLDRIGDEVARATSIVRYAPGSKFSPHVHSGGEEFLVLDGVFQDEHGDFAKGSYIRNPPTSSHTPGSELGCTIFVKLWQFDLADRTAVRLQVDDIETERDPARPSVSIAPLFHDERETVHIETWQAGARVELALPRGGEFLVLDGGFEESGDTLRDGSWLRVPSGGSVRAKVGPEGAKVWAKTRHMPFAGPIVND